MAIRQPLARQESLGEKTGVGHEAASGNQSRGQKSCPESEVCNRRQRQSQAAPRLSCHILTTLTMLGFCCALSFTGCGEPMNGVVEFPAVLVQPSAEQLMTLRAAVESTKKDWPDPNDANTANSTNTVWVDQFNGETLSLVEVGPDTSMRRKLFLSTGATGAANTEIKTAFATPISRCFLVAGPTLTVCCQLQNLTDFQLNRIAVGIVTNAHFIQTYEVLGHWAKASEARSKLVFCRSSWTRGMHTLHCLDLASGSVHDIISLRESDPGSGPSFRYFWLRKSEHLYVGGTASKMGLVDISGNFQFVYDANQRILYNLGSM